MSKVLPFLMFQDGKAEEAINYYTSFIEDSNIINLVRYGANGPGQEGSVMQAAFSLKGQVFMCMDSQNKHEFTFTPSFSIFITCDTEEEIASLYQYLGEGGEVLMPLGNFGFSQKFGWIKDKFGLSWQLNLPN